MIGMVFRGARMAARSGGQPGPRKEWGPVGKLVAGFFIVAACTTWWRPLLFIVGVLAVVSLIMVGCVMAGRRGARERASEDLDAVVESWDNDKR